MANLIRDGLPIVPPSRPVLPSRESVLTPVFAKMIRPNTERGIILQRELMEALIQGDEHTVQSALHLAATVHPLDRDQAVYAPIRIAKLALDEAHGDI